WEEQKRRLLQSLEADFDEDDEDERKSKTTIEGTIRITDEVIAQKDEELAKMRRMLEEQANSMGEVAVGANASAELVDQDEIIREERDGVKELQHQWEEKSRQSELELSLQR